MKWPKERVKFVIGRQGAFSLMNFCASKLQLHRKIIRFETNWFENKKDFLICKMLE
jgi:hypothetical protein